MSLDDIGPTMLLSKPFETTAVMPASLLFHRKRMFDDGAVMEMKLWLVPRAVPGSLHRLKYSLFYGTGGERLIGYDNERGKGDHRHYGLREEPYVFISPEALMADFLADVRQLRGEDP